MLDENIKILLKFTENLCKREELKFLPSTVQIIFSFKQTFFLVFQKKNCLISCFSLDLLGDISFFDCPIFFLFCRYCKTTHHTFPMSKSFNKTFKKRGRYLRNGRKKRLLLFPLFACIKSYTHTQLDSARVRVIKTIFNKDFCNAHDEILEI